MDIDSLIVLGRKQGHKYLVIGREKTELWDPLYFYADSVPTMEDAAGIHVIQVINLQNYEPLRVKTTSSSGDTA